MRTNRNYYKITPEEQNILAKKKIGIIGLSVGHSVAITLATERICGTLKLADFDTIELSNLNRIKTGIENIGLNKAIVTAREISQIDPFIEIICYSEGLNKNNIDDFLIGDGKLDMLIDECDDLEMKVACRIQAKKYAIPVIMETSDRGMLDVERFDLENDREILHGLLNDFPMKKLNSLTDEQKVPLILKIVDVRNASARGKASMLEVGQSISTWPQLASAVTLGGGIVADVSRRILLNQFHDSGRYYIDLESLVNDKKAVNNSHDSNPFQPFNWETAITITKNFSKNNRTENIPIEIIKEIIKAGNQAPSTGNDQPWKWVFNNGKIFLFHDKFRSWSFGNYNNIAANISFGAAYANVEIKCLEFNLKPLLKLYPEPEFPELIAIISLTSIDQTVENDVFNLSRFIDERCTNRNASTAVDILAKHFRALEKEVGGIVEAKLTIITDRDKMTSLAKIIAECDKIRLFNPAGHKDLIDKEMKWTAADVESSRDGIDIQTLGMNPGQLAAMSLIKEREVVEVLSQINGGNALLASTINTVNTGSALGIIQVPGFKKESFFMGGIAMERMWLKATELGYVIHPLISPFYLFPRIINGDGDGLNDIEINKLTELYDRFNSIFQLNTDVANIFLFKIAMAEKTDKNSLRLTLEDTLKVLNEEIK
ncbi:MAG: Rv1355c family protein [Ginsengibacter sp.]